MSVLLNTFERKVTACVIASHGLTDFDNPFFIFPYLFSATIKKRHTNYFFAAASIFHFQDDMQNKKITFFIHSIAAFIALKYNPSYALDFVGIYMLSVHVPIHYKKHAQKFGRNSLGIRIASCSTLGLSCAAATLKSRMPQKIKIGHRMKQVAIAHILNCI